MNLIETDDFLHSLERLPGSVHTLYRTQTERLKKDRRDPRLHIKKVQGLQDVFSFRVTRRYRALFYFQNLETIILFDIDHRKDVYR